MSRRKQLKAYRLTTRISQALMAENIGITQPEYSKLENGKKDFTDDMIKKLVKMDIIPELEEPVSLPDMVADAMELMEMNDQEMMMIMAQRLLS